MYGIDNSVTSLGRTVGPALSAACALWFSVRSTFLLAGLVFALACLLAAFTVCRSTPLRLFERSESGGRALGTATGDVVPGRDQTPAK